MMGIALLAFIAVFGFGDQLFGWQDASGQVQMALGLCFVLGTICGYKTRITS